MNIALSSGNPARVTARSRSVSGSVLVCNKHIAQKRPDSNRGTLRLRSAFPCVMSQIAYFFTECDGSRRESSQPPSPGASEKYFCNLSVSPSRASASGSGSLRVTITGQAIGILAVELHPLFHVRLGIGADRVGGAFGFAHAAVDALVRVDDQHVLALVEAVDRAYLDAVGVFAGDAVVGHHIGHGWPRLLRLNRALLVQARRSFKRRRRRIEVDVERLRLGRRAAPQGRRGDPDNTDARRLAERSAYRPRPQLGQAWKP